MMPTLAQGLAPVRTVLGNGAVIIAQETPTTPAVTISAAFRGGAVCDPAGGEGLSYLMGRVLDRGSARRPAEAIAQELDDRGVSLKISTSRHAHTLSCTCLAEDFDDVLAVVLEVCREARFPDDEIRKQRLEAVSILRQEEDNPATRAADTAQELLYSREHPYGRRVKGTSSTVSSLSRPDLVAHHAAHIVPAALSLVVVGAIPSDRAIDSAAEGLVNWTAAPAARSPVTSPACLPGRRQRVIFMPGKPQADIVYGFTTVSRRDPRYYAYWLMNHVLGQFGLGGRLADNIRERQGMAYYAFSTLDALPGPAPLLVRAGVDPGDVDRAIAAIDHEVAALAAHGPTPVEVEQSRAYLIGAVPRMLETNQSIAGFLQTSEAFGLGLDFDQRLPALLEDVTVDQVRAAAAEVLHPGQAAVVVAGPIEDRV